MNTASRLIAVLFLLIAVGLGAAQNPYRVYKSESSFEDVMQALKMAIEENGMYINNVMHMSEMLQRTGEDLGLGGALYSHAESIEFCSAILSRRMISENPHRIVNCPFIISVYVLPSEPDATYIVHRRINLGDDTTVMNGVEAMLESLGAAAQAAW
jgi:uncharacterized protein (DUF302 family)